MFDPRAIYDPIADKYIVSWLAGNTSNSSLIVIGFSETNDAAGNWNLYALTGDPNNNGQWSDYPMDLDYGVAPDGAQVGAPLATNDARILDGYLLGDRIEFVGNSINTDNGRAGIYHGTVSNVSTAPSISAHIISNDDGWWSKRSRLVDSDGTSIVGCFHAEH